MTSTDEATNRKVVMQPNTHSPLTNGRRPPLMRDPRILYPIKRSLELSSNSGRKLPPIVKKRTRRRVEKKDNRITCVLTGILTLQRTKVEDALTEAGFKLVANVNSQTDYVIVGDNPGVAYNKACKS